MSNKTNRQIFKKAIATLDDVTLAILRERILSITEATLSQRDEVAQKMQGTFIDAGFFLSHIEKIHGAFAFGGEK
jgi:hypothetical protein